MKIRSMEIENFKAVKRISLDNLDDTVVIAGPNGCGKSCIFDAIRLLKSVYGGYQQNEVHQWFGEFQINLQTLTEDVKRILNDKTKPLTIDIAFEFNETEKNYYRENGRTIIERNVWTTIFPNYGENISTSAIPVAEVRRHQPSVEERVNRTINAVLAELENEVFRGRLRVSVDGKIEVVPSPLLELCFTSYDPKNIGVIDYHGANRSYNREQIGGINLNIQTKEENYKNHALYNYRNKYNNIKSEMASAYIRDLIAREAQVHLNEQQNIIETLQELFRIFFPGKKFLGPKPSEDGTLTFPVELDNGATHDINELSSGEKEVLYGYLRLQNTSPKNSILLLDEPELHLNPRLIRGLPKFYQKHLGICNNNQIWLVTHSDTFLRETIGEPGFSVFHMKSALNVSETGDQIVEINADRDIEAAFLDLVGDLAAYAPNSKVVIFEGGGDSDFDLKLVTTLYPEILEKVTPISGENKNKVRQIHTLLDRAHREGVLPYRFYCIVDWDTESEESEQSSTYLTWDVYHIENYLLNPKYIAKVVNDLNAGGAEVTEAQIEIMLKRSAESTLNKLLIHKLRSEINSKLIKCIDLGINPASTNPGNDFYSAAERAATKVSQTVSNELGLEHITRRQESIKSELENQLNNGKWIKTFRGRDILKALLSEINTGLQYEKFRNLVISRMRDDGYKPEGMTNVLSKITEN